MVKALSALAALGLITACNTEPDDRIPDFEGRIDIAPAVILLGPGETRAALARFFTTTEGDTGPADFAVTTSSGIRARFDSTFRQVYRADGSLGPFPQQVEQRLLITMDTDVPSGSVTLRTGDLSQDLTIIRRP